MDRAGTFGRNVAGDAAWKGKLFEEPLQTGLILTDVGIDLTVSAFQLRVPHHRRSAVAGAGDIDHVEIVRFNDAMRWA